jgi:hypothetical protein
VDPARGFASFRLPAEKVGLAASGKEKYFFANDK